MPAGRVTFGLRGLSLFEFTIPPLCLAVLLR
jgi:hypothetical protein